MVVSDLAKIVGVGSNPINRSKCPCQWKGTEFPKLRKMGSNPIRGSKLTKIKNYGTLLNESEKI